MASQRFDWVGWEAETDLGNQNDREGVHFLTIRDNQEEIAVIIHRVSPEFPLDGTNANNKILKADMIVRALNAYCRAE